MTEGSRSRCNFQMTPLLERPETVIPTDPATRSDCARSQFLSPTTLDVTWTLRLALGMNPIAALPDSWECVFRLAIRERIAAIAWHRSGVLIRKLAPAGVSSRWRAAVAVTIESIERQLQLTADLVDTMRAKGVHPVLVKGPGLSQQLYGVPWARCSSDIDLFVNLSSRAAAAEVLHGCGGWAIEGDAPRDETWICPDRTGAAVTVELHSNAEDSVAKVKMPPLESSGMQTGDHALPTHCGNTVAAYMAAHLTKHWMTVDVPLLYYVDLLTLWDSMSEQSREEALEVARRSGVRRALQWALHRARLIASAADGNDNALQLLGLRSPASRVPGAWRVLQLADTPAAALRIIGRWIAPMAARKSLWAFALLWQQRLFGIVRILRRSRPPWASRLPAAPSIHAAYSGDVSTPRAEFVLPSRAIALEGVEFVPIVREVLAAGGSPWVRVRGGSMLPTIPKRGAVVRLESPSMPLRRGDVVLTARPGGDPVLHRIVSVLEEGIVTRGDSLPVDDAMVTRENVIAVAVEMIAGFRRGPIPEPRLWRVRRLVRQYVPRVSSRKPAERVA
jgi:hypothetical protein